MVFPDYGRGGYEGVALVRRLGGGAPEPAQPVVVPPRSLIVCALPVSRSMLERRFLSIPGRSPIEGDPPRTPATPQRLLPETDRNLTRVALSSGFRSCQHFAGASRQESGLSPTCFRQGHRSPV